MISKKICLIGSFAVGKTSLVRRFVNSIFDEKYQTTIGVKIDKKQLSLHGKDIQFVIWDLEGRDEFTELNTTYIRGASAYFVVADSTRRDTFEVALTVQKEVADFLGNPPFVFLLSKTDLKDKRRVNSDDLEAIKNLGCPLLETSAKTGKNVEEAFISLAEMLLCETEVKAS